jgi:hypothetical protein
MYFITVVSEVLQKKTQEAIEQPQKVIKSSGRMCWRPGYTKKGCHAEVLEACGQRPLRLPFECLSIGVLRTGRQPHLFL